MWDCSESTQSCRLRHPGLTAPLPPDPNRRVNSVSFLMHAPAHALKMVVVMMTLGVVCCVDVTAAPGVAGGCGHPSALRLRPGPLWRLRVR